jgi:hypothetical protein
MRRDECKLNLNKANSRLIQFELIYGDLSVGADIPRPVEVWPLVKRDKRKLCSNGANSRLISTLSGHAATGEHMEADASPTLAVPQVLLKADTPPFVSCNVKLHYLSLINSTEIVGMGEINDIIRLEVVNNFAMEE